MGIRLGQDGMTHDDNPRPQANVPTERAIMIKAPWTIEQVHALNAYQRLGYVHEFTCPESHDGRDRILRATLGGWKCPTCNYTQDWAHEWMADKSWHPKNPIDLIRNRT